VMEALAAGAYVVSSHFGALPETTLGLGELVPFDGDTPRYRAAYLDSLRAVLTRRRRDPVAFSRERFEQVRILRATATWERRAAEWEQACAAWTARRRKAA